MLLSHTHQFLFVHIPKTAGISIARALRPFSNPGERKGIRRLMSHLPVRERPDEALFPLHVTAAWARAKLPAEVFDSYCKFAVVRNPYDRAVSYYEFLKQRTEHHRHGRVRDLDFSGFLDHLAGLRRDETQTSMVADGRGRLLIDRVLRFEHLDGDFADLCSSLKIDATALPKNNGTKRHHYLDYYRDNRVVQQVQELFADDFIRFGYDDDPKWQAPVYPIRLNVRTVQRPVLARREPTEAVDWLETPPEDVRVESRSPGPFEMNAPAQQA